MSVQQHGVVGAVPRAVTEGRDLHHDERGESGQFDDVDGEAGDLAPRTPTSDVFDGPIHVTERLPLRFVRLRDVGDRDVVADLRQHVVVPDGRHVFGDDVVGFESRHGRASQRRTLLMASITFSASATIWRTRSPAGVSSWIAPTPCPHGMNSFFTSTSVSGGKPMWLAPA